jgi:hypothetical protein
MSLAGLRLVNACYALGLAEIDRQNSHRQVSFVMEPTRKELAASDIIRDGLLPRQARLSWILITPGSDFQ